MQKDLEAPTTDEGFEEVIVLRSFHEANHLLACWGATPPEARPLGFFKFPTTPHVVDLTNGRALQESDRLLKTSDAQQFFNGQNVLIVEEKIDGANLGISLTADWEPRFQNRAKYVTSKYATQWKALDQWWEEHSWEVCRLLEPEVEVLFGEWTWQRHSVEYTKLPAYFVAFDIYNKSEGRFVSARERDRRLLELGGGIPAVPRLAERAFGSRAELEALLDLRSAYSDGPLEGIYLRMDEPDEQGGGLWNSRRGKIVRADFIQGIEDGGHFINKEVVRNKLA
jgi:atypical dual specificity phosphatase